MFNSITHYNIWVTDQDEALDFYVGKLGMEVNADVQLEFMRWLTVSVPGRPEHQIILCPLGPPVVAPDNVEQARDLLSKGIMGTIILDTPDCRATYETLRARGVEFTQEPVEQPFGIDCAARDPFGNQIRIGQQIPVPTEAPGAAGQTT
jgi:catechol 2,3-dioxygenase-like lactoylglutathione lyase family enzyme